MIQNCLLHKDLQVWIATICHKMYIFLFDEKNTIENPKYNFLTIICELWKKRISLQICSFQWDLQIQYVKVCAKMYINVYVY